MVIFTYSKARQQFSSLLDKANKDGQVFIKRKNGQIFSIKPERNNKKSPLDVDGIGVGLSRNEILSFIHESRKRI
jgi:hypothetical protein